MILNKEEVERFLPHRDPFLFIDSVKEVLLLGEEKQTDQKVETTKELEGAKVSAFFTPKSDMKVFEGHFPGRPIFPGVLQIEMMAQAASFILTKLGNDIFSKKLEMSLASVVKAKFRAPVLPDQTLEVRITCLKIRGTMMSYHCKLYHEEKLISEVELMAQVKIL